MYPILTRLPYAFLYSYTVTLGVGVLAAVALLLWHGRSSPAPALSRAQRFDALLWSLAGAILGGRVAFVGRHSAYFAQHPQESWQLLDGGLGYYGALYGGLLALGMYCWLGRQSWTAALWLLAPALTLLHACGWLACLLEGCAYGRQTLLSWYTVNWPDSYGVYAVRYPVQGVGSLVAGVLFVWCVRSQGRGRFWLALCALSLLHGGLTLYRGDAMPWWGSLRADSWLAAGTAVAALIGWWRTAPTASPPTPT